MDIFDAAIVGFGPVGATLANLLGKTGLGVLVIDKEADIYDKPRAIGIDHESLRTLQSCGMGDALSSIISPYKGGLYLGVDGLPIRSFSPVPPPYPLGWPPNATFVQPELERLLRGSAERQANIRVELSTELVGIESTSDGLMLSTQSAGSCKVQGAKYLIGCDGANSFVRRHFKTGFEDLNFDEWWVVVDAWVKDLDAVPTTSRQYCFPTRPGTYVVGPRNLRRWEFKLLPGETAHQFSSPVAVRDALNMYVDTNAIDIWRIAPYRFHALVVDTWQFGNAFLAGDAAHQTPPFLGQGMNSGIRDAANLAWRLALVERHGAASSLLKQYEQERRPHFRAVVHHAKELGLIIGELDMERARQRDIQLRGLMSVGQLSTSRQSFVPNLSAGLLHSRDAKITPPVGELFPQPRIQIGEGRQALLDDHVASGFLLVLTDVNQIDWISHNERRRLAELGASVILIRAQGATGEPTGTGVQAFIEQGRVFNNWIRRHGVSTILVRPDHYVYAAANCSSGLKSAIRDLHEAIFPALKASRD